MCKKYVWLVGLVAVIGCGRSNLAPVEMKLDGDGDIVGYENYSSSSSSSYAEVEKNVKKSNVYIVKSGETLFDIANKLNMDPISLAQANELEYPYTVYTGQKLRLPSSDLNSGSERLILPDEKEPENVVDQDSEINAQKSEMKATKEKEEDLNGELDEMFASIGGHGSKSNTASETSSKTETSSKKVVKEEIKDSKGTSFLEQEEQLSQPKIKAEKKNAVSNATKEKDIVEDDIPSAETKVAEKKEAIEAVKPEVKSSSWVSPVKGKVTSKFGDVVDGEANDGIDIKAPLGTPVKAASDGTVIYAGEGNGLDSAYGKAVFIDHKDGVVSSYTHLNAVNIKNGAKVKAGDVIGTVGKSGDVNEPMLHFEMTKGVDASPVNPSKYVKF